MPKIKGFSVKKEPDALCIEPDEITSLMSNRAGRTQRLPWWVGLLELKNLGERFHVMVVTAIDILAIFPGPIIIGLQMIRSFLPIFKLNHSPRTNRVVMHLLANIIVCPINNHSGHNKILKEQRLNYCDYPISFPPKFKGEICFFSL